MNPRSWLSEYKIKSVRHLATMAFFYYVLGVIFAASVAIIGDYIFEYSELESYIPRTLISVSFASPIEETLFFGIPFYFTGNQYMMLGTGILWSVIHLSNTEYLKIAST